MKLLDKRIGVICNDLKKLSISQKQPLENWNYKRGNYLYPKDADEAAENWENFDSRTMHWYGPDQHYWFRTTLTVPEAFDKKTLWLNVKTQIEEWDDAKNPQFLLFVNQVAVQGIDMNHRQVLLSECAVAGEELVLDLQAYTGILHTEFNLTLESLSN